MTVDVSQVVARQIHSWLGCHRRWFHGEWATLEQTAYITGINKAILYSVFWHYCEKGSGPMIRLASEKYSERAFPRLGDDGRIWGWCEWKLLRGVFLQFRAPFRDAREKIGAFFRHNRRRLPTDDHSHLLESVYYMSAWLGCARSRPLTVCWGLRAPAHIAGSRSTFIVEHVKLNI